MAAEPYKVLALDGGGVRGIFAAAVLAELESRLSLEFHDTFDLIVGTSTGGIIALGLASGMTAQEALDFYKDEGRAIFSHPRRISRLWRHKYSREPLDQALREIFGDLTMNDLKSEVAVTAHELVSGTTRVWKDDHHPALAGGGQLPVWKVAAATSAAPTFFDPVQIGTADSHIDGGIWANNPAMVGIVEAVRYAERDLGSIRLASVGTTARVFRAASHEAAMRLGTWGWIKEARDLLLGAGTSMSASYQAQLLLPPGHFLRLDKELAASTPLDDFESALSLEEVGRQTARIHSQEFARLLGLDP